MHPESTDVLVIGAGLAGMATAPVAAAASARGHAEQGSGGRLRQRLGAGGIAAAQAPDDSIEAHVQDTLVAGAGLCDPDAVRRILAQGPAAIDWLLGLGVPFTRDEDGRSLHLTRAGRPRRAPHRPRGRRHRAGRTPRCCGNAARGPTSG